MPTSIIIVDDDQGTRQAVLAALRGANLDATAFDDPMAALNAIENDSKAHVVVSRVGFGPGKLNGLALVRMLRHKQVALSGRSGLQGVFIGPPEISQQAEQEGDFVPIPLDPQALLAAVGKALLAE